MKGAFDREKLIATGLDDSDFSALIALGYTIHEINPHTLCRMAEGFRSNAQAEREIAESKQLYGKDGLD